MSAQETLFSLDDPVPPAPPVERSFRVCFFALMSLRYVGAKVLRTLVDATEGDLALVWDRGPAWILSILQEAKTPHAPEIAEAFASSDDALISDAIALDEQFVRQGITLLSPPEIPERLRNIPDYPRWLFVHGDVKVLYHRPAIAIVGTRQPSDGGKRATALVARTVAAYETVVVSGLAEGVDEIAHETTLRYRVPNIAFLGHGINIVFPAKTRDLRFAIIHQGGAVVSEYLPDDHYQKARFVHRNRLQAALADAVIPVEARAQGGTAHTVRFAWEYSREVFGIAFKDANGLIGEIDEAGVPVFDVFTAIGRRGLDQAIRKIADREGRDTYALALIERQIMHEMTSRNTEDRDVERLVENVRRFAERMRSSR